ncbi:unnamed protein product [Phytomonas sp. Hart1]|nr:unnamed protein product [Phytomonas sp. Hart1]|eukprot:CCW68429.1 unnamed protein product [Phytomonas sp. isolate Hart1]
MDAAQQELRCFQLARKLHLLPLLNEVFTTNSLVHPIFYPCLDPRAKELSKLIYLCLWRWLKPSISDAGGTTYPISDIADCILSFLSFSHLTPTSPPKSLLLHQSCQSSPSTFHRPTNTLLANPTVTPPQLQPPLPSSNVPPPLTLEGNSPVDTENTPSICESSSSKGDPALSNKMVGDNLLVGGADKTPEQDTLYRPMFYVRQLKEHSTALSINHAIFIRMAHTIQLNEESLNPYFGRYGQISCSLQRRVRLSEYSRPPSEEFIQSLLLMFNCDLQSLLIQDFIVSVDSYQNAVHAVHQAYYKELLFIAFHDACQDTHCIADLDVMQSNNEVCYYVRPSLTKESAPALTNHHRYGSRRKRLRLHNGAASDLERVGDMSTSSFSSLSSSSSSSSSASSIDKSFVPDVIVDGLPHWATEGQLKVLLQEHGKVESIRMSVDDLSGAFTGVILVRMSTAEEAIQLSNALHQAQFDSHTLQSGVLNDRLEIEAIEDGNEIRSILDESLPASFDINLNQRAWV